MTSEKLAEFRAKGILEHPKFDRLAVIGDKWKEDESNHKKINKFEVFKKIYLLNTDINRSQIAYEIGVSRQTVIKWIKLLNSNEDKSTTKKTRFYN